MARKVKKMSNKRYFDYSLLFVIIFIVGFGLVMIYSTSSYTAQMEYGSSEYYFKKQLIFDVLGFIMMYIMYRLDYHVLRKIAPAFFALSLLLILALIPFGKTANGATRWIRFGPIGVQPVCKGIQSAAAVDSYVTPEPWAMPGYESEVIMAAGAFVQGSSIELSADGPIRPPYAVYFQGGLTWFHGKLGILLSMQKLADAGIIKL